ncbi:unnamed protein product [Cuscuta epithymum]|uniref:GAG-pre-integrase domain-containing protein n=1 Tax=Cuscuta epithymum TaxID=186058 RepID=A0AAV0D600_9ASTE|nr:unnamed protein product [Cuscuta epithymum]
MGNQDRSKIVGIGDIVLTTSTGCKLVLKDVRHVPAMRLNLISAGKLDDAGLMNYFGEGKWKLTKGSLVMARGKKEGSLYVMQAKLCKGEVNITTDDMEVWHKRLGHISEKGLHILARKHLLPDMKGHLFTFPKMSEQSLMQRQRSVSTFAHPRMNLAIGYGIQSIRRLFVAEMSSSSKIKRLKILRTRRSQD